MAISKRELQFLIVENISRLDDDKFLQAAELILGRAIVKSRGRYRLAPVPKPAKSDAAALAGDTVKT